MKYDVAIIGGGVIGSSIAYNLTKQGVKNIAIFEKSYIASGATGRCGGGIRQQWASPNNCKLAIRSVKLFEQLNEELDYDTEYYQGGYLLLAYGDEEMEQFNKNVAMQSSAGVPVRIINVPEIKKMFPFLNLEGVSCGAHCPTDGHANPMLVNQGYANAARRNGAKIHLFTEVISIERQGNKLISLTTKDGEKYEVGAIINAAGGFSFEVAKMAGLSVPTRSQRHEALITEALEHFMDPLIISFKHHIYFRQTMHGSVLMGYGDANEPYSHNIESSLDFLKIMSKQISDLVPGMKNVKIVRQWAGSYNMTPDAQPIIGKMPELDNYYQAIGFSGHVLMLAPAVAEIMADLVTKEKTDYDYSELTIDRFLSGKDFSAEKAVV
jgi:sarcosine oxidase subunit beta